MLTTEEAQRVVAEMTSVGGDADALVAALSAMETRSEAPDYAFHVWRNFGFYVVGVNPGGVLLDQGRYGVNRIQAHG